MPWEVEYTDEFEVWFNALDQVAQEAIAVAVEFLEREGPALVRPLADTVTQSRHANMKELRPGARNIRVLFAFDPRRMAILLLGGDKTHHWAAWYDVMVPLADKLYDEHLATLGKEGLLP